MLLPQRPHRQGRPRDGLRVLAEKALAGLSTSWWEGQAARGPRWRHVRGAGDVAVEQLASEAEETPATHSTAKAVANASRGCGEPNLSTQPNTSLRPRLVQRIFMEKVKETETEERNERRSFGTEETTTAFLWNTVSTC